MQPRKRSKSESRIQQESESLGTYNSVLKRRALFVLEVIGFKQPAKSQRLKLQSKQEARKRCSSKQEPWKQQMNFICRDDQESIFDNTIQEKKKNHSCACTFKRKKPDKRQRLRQRTGENVTEAKKDVSGKLKTIYKQISQETSMSMKRTGKGQEEKERRAERNGWIHLTMSYQTKSAGIHTVKKKSWQTRIDSELVKMDLHIWNLITLEK